MLRRIIDIDKSYTCGIILNGIVWCKSNDGIPRHARHKLPYITIISAVEWGVQS